METMEEKHGGISVKTEHIFPVIKKWLYSEKEIFIREIVSNACDAVTKLKRLASLGEYEDKGDNYRIDVTLDEKLRTITVRDNGIGMSGEELEKYLCNIALSGALDFVEKYEGKGGGSGIIGHFGLGFYSSFMVSDKVEVVTRSYLGTPAVKWECGEDGDYTVSYPSGNFERGTSVIMHINDEGNEYLNLFNLRAALEKYCGFMPVEIYLHELGEDGKEKKKEEAEKPINDIHPLWTKPASECTDEEYKKFYSKVFDDYREPLFYLHINADYPLNYKGILYFPKMRDNFESVEGKIKLYYNQVFVADNIKEVIPEYLLMLRGVLDCPELPLNVSRSYLQNSGYVTKISQHIVRKVGDKLNSLFTGSRAEYEKMWDDIKTFVEYASVSDKKFFDRVNASVLFRTASGKYVTLADYLGEDKATDDGKADANEAADTAKDAEPEATDKKTDGKTAEKKVYYVSDDKLQSALIQMYAERGIDVIVFDSVLDERYAQTVEAEKKGVRFVRIDADTSALHSDGEKLDDNELVKLFSSFAPEKLTVKTEPLFDPDTPALLTISEEERRMSDMMKLYMPDAPASPVSATLTLNSSCESVRKLANGDYGDDAILVAKYIYYTALISQRRLEGDEMKEFLAVSRDVIKKL